MTDRAGRRTASDAELLGAARAGDAGAFAVLLRRHAALFVDLAAGPDGERVLLRLGVRALRELGRLDPRTPVDAWLAGLADAERARVRVEPPAAVAAERLGGSVGEPRDWLDRWWSELSSRWPDGRARRRLPGWARASIAAALIALGGSVGTTALLRERPAPPLIAQVQAYAEPARGDDFAPEDDPDAGELPVFTFPEDDPTPTDPAPTDPEDGGATDPEEGGATDGDGTVTDGEAADDPAGNG